MQKFKSVEQIINQLKPEKPVYCIRKNSIRSAVKYFNKNFPGKILYAVKTNPHPEVIKTIIDSGVEQFDVASIEEIKSIRNFSQSAKCSYMHTVKSRESIKDAYFNYNIKTFSLDTKDELIKIIEATNQAKDLELFVRVAVLKFFIVPNTINKLSFVNVKLLFNIPFVRFWFAFISPIFKGIRDGNYEEFEKLFQNRKAEFTETIFEQLSHELVKFNLKDDSIYSIGRYWDDDIDIDLLCTTKKGVAIAGSCKYTNSKVKKSELNNLKQKCKDAKINVDTFMLFSKSGFSSELKSQKGENLKLFTVKSLKSLI